MPQAVLPAPLKTSMMLYHLTHMYERVSVQCHELAVSAHRHACLKLRFFWYSPRRHYAMCWWRRFLGIAAVELCVGSTHKACVR